MGLLRRMFLAAIAEVGKAKREARVGQDPGMVRVVDPTVTPPIDMMVPSADITVVNGRPLSDGDVLLRLTLPPEHDVTTIKGMRDLFGAELRKAQEKLRTRN